MSTAERERIGAWADFVYLRAGHVTHVRPFLPGIYGVRSVLCGRVPKLFEDWLGTGEWYEQMRAADLPLCARCLTLSEGRNA